MSTPSVPSPITPQPLSPSAPQSLGSSAVKTLGPSAPQIPGTPQRVEFLASLIPQPLPSKPSGLIADEEQISKDFLRISRMTELSRDSTKKAAAEALEEARKAIIQALESHEELIRELASEAITNDFYSILVHERLEESLVVEAVTGPLENRKMGLRMLGHVASAALEFENRYRVPKMNLPDKKILKAVTRMLKDPNSGIRYEAVKCFVQMSVAHEEPFLPKIQSLGPDPNPEIRLLVHDLVVQQITKDPTNAAEGLWAWVLESLGDEDLAVRREGVSSITPMLGSVFQDKTSMGEEISNISNKLQALVLKETQVSAENAAFDKIRSQIVTSIDRSSDILRGWHERVGSQRFVRMGKFDTRTLNCLNDTNLAIRQVVELLQILRDLEGLEFKWSELGAKEICKSIETLEAYILPQTQDPQSGKKGEQAHILLMDGVSAIEDSECHVTLDFLRRELQTEQSRGDREYRNTLHQIEVTSKQKEDDQLRLEHAHGRHRLLTDALFKAAEEPDPEIRHNIVEAMMSGAEPILVGQIATQVLNDKSQVIRDQASKALLKAYPGIKGSGVEGTEELEGVEYPGLFFDVTRLASGHGVQRLPSSSKALEAFRVMLLRAAEGAILKVEKACEELDARLHTRRKPKIGENPLFDQLEICMEDLGFVWSTIFQVSDNETSQTLRALALKSLESRTWAVRQAAIGLGAKHCGHQDFGFCRRIPELLRDKSWQVRGAMLSEVSRLEPLSPSTLELLSSLAEPAVRQSRVRDEEVQAVEGLRGRGLTC
mmetsp:Transcript_31877/g.49851  ORF Transcript_31877/g.49851 Transcript_31877/m.49851 type:complete len:775 (+) Transcript_31877:1972-4296(+)